MEKARFDNVPRYWYHGSIYFQCEVWNEYTYCYSANIYSLYK